MILLIFQLLFTVFTGVACLGAFLMLNVGSFFAHRDKPDLLALVLYNIFGLLLVAVGVSMIFDAWSIGK